ncbi:MAG TPA: hypothetical protein VGA52_14910 [Anaerolineales bacterium]
MSTHRPRKHRRPARQADGPALIVVFGVVAGTMSGYLLGETGWAASGHPNHWGVAVAGGIAGWLAGKIYFRGRSDIVYPNIARPPQNSHPPLKP